MGFTYTYNRDKDNGQGMNQSQTGRYFRSPAGVIRGGIGDFRDLLRPGILANASAATGLAGGTSVLSCVGSAVPVPDWSRFASDPGSIPSQCLDGSGVLGEVAPSVSLIDKGYDVPHSWRASLDWNSNYRNWVVRVGGLASYDLSQPGTVDANFAGAPKLTLADEGNRPVFVSAAAIDPRSGAVSAAESRRSDQFGPVDVRTSDLRGYGGQLNFGLAPDVFKFRAKYNFYTSLGYTLQASRREYRGFDGGGFGDPRVREWAPNSNDARHVIVLSGGMFAPKVGTITFFARAQSGLPFTPQVQGDVNGDGRSGDRAFIPNVASETDAVLATQLRALIADGSPSARRCLLDNAGTVVSRNGCRGPWTQSLNVQWSPRLPQRISNRVTPNIYLQNVLAGVDQALHGSNGLRGWGSPAVPDPVLLVPRGFDAAANRFQYDVNSRFADTRPGHTVLSNPFRIVIDFSMNLSTDFDLQQLRRAVEPVKGPAGWMRRSADSLAAFYLSNTSSIHKVLLSQSDSLFLTGAQIVALRRADSVYSARVRAVYIPLGQFLAAGEGGAGKAELDSVQASQKAYWKIFWEQPEIADSIVNASQRELMPMLKSMLGVPGPASGAQPVHVRQPCNVCGPGEKTVDDSARSTENRAPSGGVADRFRPCLSLGFPHCSSVPRCSLDARMMIQSLIRGSFMRLRHQCIGEPHRHGGRPHAFLGGRFGAHRTVGTGCRPNRESPLGSIQPPRLQLLAIASRAVCTRVTSSSPSPIRRTMSGPTSSRARTHPAHPATALSTALRATSSSAIKRRNTFSVCAATASSSTWARDHSATSLFTTYSASQAGGDSWLRHRRLARQHHTRVVGERRRDDAHEMPEHSRRDGRRYRQPSHA